MSDLHYPAYVEMPRSRTPALSVVLEGLKPITWFAPMWAFMCGAVSSGGPLLSRWPWVVAGMVLAGPAVCGASQAVNDWYDRHVDAINEPQRPIPSGRMPGRWGLYIALAMTAASLLLASALGAWVLAAAGLGLVLAWIYSAPPLRLKQRGWWGPASVALCYEGLSWFTGAAVTGRAFPGGAVIVFAALYSFGAIGIMVLNDFKAVEGDRKMGVLSVPVDLGVENAAGLACLIMAAPQGVVIALLALFGHPIAGGLVLASLLAQGALMRKLLRDPKEHAPWYNATGTSLYVLGMLVSGIALGLHHGGAL
jgi:chlorophyll synthase